MITLKLRNYLGSDERKRREIGSNEICYITDLKMERGGINQRMWEAARTWKSQRNILL